MIKKLLAVIMLVMVASLLVSGCVTTPNQQTVQANSTTPTSSQNSPTVSVAATSLGSSNSLTSSYGTPTAAALGNKFVTYAIYCQNINAPNIQMANPNYLKLRDTQGNIYTYDSSTFSLQQQVNGVTLKGLTYETNTQPGDKVSGLDCIPNTAKRNAKVANV